MHINIYLAFSFYCQIFSYVLDEKGQDYRKEYAATSKLDETVKADDGWLFLGASESKIFPANLADSLHKELEKKSPKYL